MAHRTLALLLLISAFVRVAEGQQADLSRPSLTGTVTSVNGQPLAGIRVDISTAAPKVGRGIFCPSCYLDCGKWTTTSARGEFSFTQLDPSLKFRLVLTSPAHRATQTALIDPLDGRVELSMRPRPEDVGPDRAVSGTVTHNGAPVVGALVEPHGAKKLGRRWWGRVDGVEPTVTDQRGYFEMALPDEYSAVDIRITGHGFCGEQLNLLEPGAEPLSIAVTSGASVTGKLTHNGEPALGMSVAVVQLERGTTDGIFIAAVGDVTNQNGEFEFRFLPPDEKYCIYSVVGDAKRSQSPFILTSKTFRAPASGLKRDLGSLEVRFPLAIHGRVERIDGEPLPNDLKLSLGRNPAWDLVGIAVEEDGSFVANGLPPETYEIRIGSRALVLVGERLPFQLLERASFGVRLEEPLDNLIIPVRGR